MSERQFKTALMDESAVNRALIRITHEIVEKNKGCVLFMTDFVEKV